MVCPKQDQYAMKSFNLPLVSALHHPLLPLTAAKSLATDNRLGHTIDKKAVEELHTLSHTSSFHMRNLPLSWKT